LRLFSAAFTREEIAIFPYGDRKTAVAFLYGLAAEDLEESAFQHADADCPLLIGVRAIKKPDAA